MKRARFLNRKKFGIDYGNFQLYINEQELYEIGWDCWVDDPPNLKMPEHKLLGALINSAIVDSIIYKLYDKRRKRAINWLSDVEDNSLWSLSYCCDHLNYPTETVRVRCLRAIKRIRKALEQKKGSDKDFLRTDTFNAK